MIKGYIDGTEVTGNMGDGSLQIVDQLQNKANTAGFMLNAGASEPSHNEEVLIYDAVAIVADLTSDLALYLPMNEGSGSLVRDKSGGFHHGTVTSATFVEGKYDTALSFDGASGDVLVTDHADIQNIWDGGGMICGFIKIDSDGESDEGRIVDKGNSGSSVWHISTTDESGGFVRLTFQMGFSTTDGVWRTDQEIPINRTVFFAVVYDADSTSNDPTVYFDYGDGLNTATINETSTPAGTRTTDAGENLYIGNRADDDRTFDGFIDDFRIYDASKTQTFASYLTNGGDLVVEELSATGFSVLPDGQTTDTKDGRGKFRVGQRFWVSIGESTEEVQTVLDIRRGDVSNTVNIELENTLSNAHNAGEFAGKRIFGGTVSSLTKQNPRLLSDVDYRVGCTDFTKIFDRKLINDSWEDVDGQYIINDFLNTTVNYNKEVDDMDYDDDSAVQAEWIESGDGDNPTRNATSYVQGSNSITFPWTNSSGSATFSATPDSGDFSAYVGASSGAPAEGNLTFWFLWTSALNSSVDYISIRIGSDASNYVELDVDVFRGTLVDDAWQFVSLALTDGEVTGTPDWTAIDYVATVVNQNATGSISIDDIRITAEGSFKPTFVETTTVFDDVRAAFKKPTSFINRLAKTLGDFWFIDYEKNIHFFDQETNSAPFSITDSSNNFDRLTVDVDTSQLKNRQTVRGGTKTSDNTYAQVFEGDGTVREWILKSQFSNLVITLDDNTSTDSMETGTTETNVVATAHGLETGDHIVNRSHSNAVRQITKVDDDNFTVEAVSGQGTGDIFSKFDTSKDVGVENLVDETTVDYVSNFNEKSVRATDSEETLDSTTFIRFEYNEIIPIRVQMTDPASIATMKALIGGDGIFDGAVITDQSLDSTQAARDRGQAEVDQYSNPIVSIRFETDHEGLESGQIVTVNDTNKNINDDYMIQKVTTKYKDGKDFPVFRVTAASTLFGIIEYFQKLSESDTDRLIDSEETIDQIYAENVTMTLSPTDTVNSPGESASESVTMTLTPTSDTADERDMTTDPYVWQPDASDARWNLAQWG